jgi:hypothetical protein
MRLEVHVHADIPILEGVSRKQIEQALAPWLEYLDAEALTDVKSLEADEPGVRFDEKELLLLVCWTGEIGRSFYAALDASLSRTEIDRLRGKVDRDGLTVVATSCYFKNNRAKLEIALGRGKKAHDKRHSLREKVQEKEARQAVRRGRG